jgi:DNA-binding beta-propeller fold protein YncE
VFAKALAKPVAERYQSCTEFAEALRDAFGIRPYDSGPGSAPGLPHPRTQLVGAVSGADVTAPAGQQGFGQQGIGQQGSGPGGQATQVRGVRATSPDLTAEHWQQPDGGGYRRPWYRAPAAIAAAVLFLIAAAGGGGYLALHHHKSGNDKRHGPVVPLAVPGCTTNVASAGTLNLPSSFTTVQGGNPFSVQVTKSGKFVFAITPTTLNVLVRSSGLKLTESHFYNVASGSMAMNGGVLTNDEKYLVVAAGKGADIFSVADAEAGISPLVGMLTVPGIPRNASSVEVVLSPDNQFAFVTVKTRDILAVFNLGKALANHAFQSATFVGSVRLGSNPVGVTLSPDGKWLYVTSYSTSDSITTGEGLLSVLDVAKAETSTSGSVVAQTSAGCGPARVITSRDGKTVWVTARSSNALLGFSASLLRSDPHHALIAKVTVGQTPIGLTLVNGGTRLIIADTDVENTGPTAHNLAVVNVAAALARKPALLGFIPAGALPREFATIPGGRYLLVSDNGSHQVQVLDLSKLP